MWKWVAAGVLALGAGYILIRRSSGPASSSPSSSPSSPPGPLAGIFNPGGTASSGKPPDRSTPVGAGMGFVGDVLNAGGKAATGLVNDLDQGFKWGAQQLGL